MKTILKAVVLYAFLILMTFVFLYPIYFVIISSLKADTYIFTSPFLPSLTLEFDNFRRAFEIGNIGRQFINSMILASSTVVLTALLSCMIAFALSRLTFKGSNAVRVFFVVGLMVPIQSIIVPLAFIVNTLSLRDNYILMILLYSAFNMPLSIFVITGFMKSLPSSLEEAAVIDGCNIYHVFLRIIFPLSKPAIATVSIFVFMYTWNDLLAAMVLIGKAQLRTVSVGLLNFVGAHNSDYGALMAAISIIILPPLLVYILMQENVVKGITAGSNK